MNKYQEVNGTFYHKDTNGEIIRILENARINRTRLCIEYGDTKTGRQWGDHQTGYIGRSTGIYKIPLSIFNSRCIGGEAILDNCIIKIHNTKTREIYYNIIARAESK
jgi:hypothetical protein